MTDLEQQAREALQQHAGYEISRWDVQDNCSVLAKDAIAAMLAFRTAQPGNGVDPAEVWRQAYVAVYGCEPTHPKDAYQAAYDVIGKALSTPQRPESSEKRTMCIDLTDLEQEALERLMAEQELSAQRVMIQALRQYQSDHERRKAGEMVTWSGDAQRARDFAGDLSRPERLDREAVALDAAMLAKAIRTACEDVGVDDDYSATARNWIRNRDDLLAAAILALLPSEDGWREERERLRAALEECAELVRVMCPVIPNDGPRNEAELREYETLGGAYHRAMKALSEPQEPAEAK